VEETGIVSYDCDDDGETAAGSRLAEMIRLMEVNNVAVIVTRWYGGIHMGTTHLSLLFQLFSSVMFIFLVVYRC
jgi:putative IMPACT (imprinted ancient) family translation regulator